MDAATMKSMKTPKRVLLVHDGQYDIDDIYETISGEFVLRIETSVLDAVNTARAAPFSCIACLLGGDIDGSMILSSLGKDQTRALLFVRTPYITEEAAAFMLTSGVPWISLPLSPNEVLASVRRIVVDGHL